MRIVEYNTELGENNLPILKKEKAVNFDINNLRTADNVVNMMNGIFKANAQTEEHVWLLAFNTKINLLGVFEVAHGTVAHCEISPREIMMKSLLCGAVNILLVHNHPSQDCFPSREDITFTHRMKNVCDLMNIRLIDHIIIGKGYISLHEKEMLK